MDDEDPQEGEYEENDLMDHSDGLSKKEEIKTITSEMVDSWCKAILEERRIGAIRNIMRAFRSACHFGDEDNESKLTSISSPVFNKILLFVLSEMDGILRTILKLPSSGGKKEMILDLMNTRPWKNYNHLVKAYLGNALHVLNQMTDTDMIAFTLRRLKFSSLFLAAFPSLLRKYIKVRFLLFIYLFMYFHFSFLMSCFRLLQLDVAIVTHLLINFYLDRVIKFFSQKIWINIELILFF